jgi:hypothetical protein
MLSIKSTSPLLQYGVAVPVVGAANRNGRGEKVALSGMRESVSLSGGRFGLHSEPGRETTVEPEVELLDTDHDG